ncbi:hypothetical protein HMPREF0208_04265 [Citrobacter koseri]|nr:hypothetical protein HMPREF3207_02064 [Citrobacter koseri]KXA03271.1 hypothetical protein HMPREF3220_00787 [Citrobacter koseri]KXB40569.1 hypothetical protein HMPREF0208_04265 [Citrobacter koseri]
MPGIPARQRHITLQQGGSFMQHTIRAPAIRTGKNRGRPICFTNTFVLGMDQIQRLIPTHPHKFILTAHALWLLWRGEKSFTHHRETHPGRAVNLVAYDGLQGIEMRSGQRPARRENRLAVSVDPDRSPVGGG